MRHAISVLLQNEVGALTRLTGMFSTRGYNIETLNVAPTYDPRVSRVTLVVSGSDAAIAQLNAQLAKLVDVVNIHDMTLGDHFERELCIVKLKLATGGLAKAMSFARKHGADILDDAQVSCTIQLTGRVSDIDAYIKRIEATNFALSNDDAPQADSPDRLSPSGYCPRTRNSREHAHSSSIASPAATALPIRQA